jgi:threonine synthase
MLHTERQSDGQLKNLRVAAVEGTSDDLDRPIEVILQNPELRTQHKLGSVNSVNIVRMLAQMIHFFWSYFRAVPSGSSERVSFAIPTGAAGHATSCLLAKLAGLPINKILVANNQVPFVFVCVGLYPLC